MSTAPVQRPIEREYRNLIYDNRRWRQFVARPGDIIVCTPAKCGTTWMQTIVAALLFPDGDAPGPVTHEAPWIEARFEPIDEVVSRLDAQTHRRSVKSHTPADGIPWFPEAAYIVVGRDGRDAFMSFLNHMRNLRPEVVMHLATTALSDGINLGRRPPLDDPHEFFAWWLEEPQWFDHVATFWHHRGAENVIFVHYDDMKTDLSAEMHRVAAFLDAEPDQQAWPQIVERCTFESMKARSDEISDFGAFVGGADTFLYKGTNGRWRDVLTKNELSAFDRRSRELLPDDARAWTTGH